jgi:phosphoribosyl-ATP pyrophosphohydrolase
MQNFIEELDNIIADRKKGNNPDSYTASLFKQGKDRILKKIGEEAGEVIIASKNNDPEELKNEAADLVFHLMVTLQEQNLTFKDVVEILKSRHRK